MPQEQRVLGVLLEKQVTVPASYPMTLAAVRTGCNQSSSRDPVVDYDEPTVEATLRGSRTGELVRIVWADTGRRTLKYHQLLAEVLELDRRRAGAGDRAAAARRRRRRASCRTRTERLHAFADRGEVEVVLAGLAARPEPLVRELPRQRGQHDARWVHLLGRRRRRPTVAVAEPAPAVDREAVLAAGAEARDQRVRSSYDAVAAAYADHLVDELRRPQPFETWLLRPGRCARRRRAGGRGRLRSGPRHGLPRRGRVPTRPGSTSRRAWSRRRGGGSRTGDYQVGDLRRLMRPTHGAGWTRRARVVLPHPPRRVRAARRPRRARAAAAPRRLARGRACTPAPRSGTSTSGSTRRSTSTSSCTTRAEVVRLVEDAGLTDVEWYHRGADRRPRRDHRAALRRRPKAGLPCGSCSRPRPATATSFPMLQLARAFRDGRARRPVGHRRPGDCRW